MAMKMHLFPFAVIAFAMAPSLNAQDSPAKLTLEHRMLLRCSAAFAIVAHGQGKGDPEALAYPPMEEAGREFFVRASAQVMDEAGLDREALEKELSAQAQAMRDSGQVVQIMPTCLSLLDDGSP